MKTKFHVKNDGAKLVLKNTIIGKVYQDKQKNQVIDFDLSTLLNTDESGKKWIDKQFTNAAITNCLAVFGIDLVDADDEYFIKINGVLKPLSEKFSITYKINS